MLKRLFISDYALIEKLDIDFSEGFNVITGETGAGKSIIMGALSLVMGGRGDASAVRKGAKKCVVEAEFSIGEEDDDLREMTSDFDVEDMVILRREMTAQGKSRAFVNDTPVSLQVMKSVSSEIIDIHSQHQNLLIERKDFQLNVIDIVAGNEKELAEYQKIYKQYIETGKRLDLLKAEIEASEREREYDEFQFKQLEEAKLVEGEQESLEEEQSRLEHAEEIKGELCAASNLMCEEASGILTQLKECVQRLRKAGKYVDSFNGLADDINERYMDIREMASDVERQMNDIVTDDVRKSQVDERLSELYTLEQKHKVKDCGELIALQHELEQKIKSINIRDEELQWLSVEYGKCKKVLEEKANILSGRRKQVIGEIGEKMVGRLVYLGIPNAKVEIIISEGDYGVYGADEVEIRFAANKNATPQNIGKIASGGEMARVMLTLKALMAEKRGLQTIIFDEIDTGVSGEMAGRMGEVMQQVALSSQVIAITHLPQIAAQGDTHYKVYKEDQAESTVTNIRRLATAEREYEIAEMLSGKNPSETAILAAKELLNGKRG
ncbi:MAG: DNA repair protein RecN [Paludibacteraceae bacterium]|nr:DNA repair protein RecN [Paludibacteraceae bacterium]